MAQLADDTMVALSQRTAGGNSFAVPPMAVTVGMGDILAARKLHLITDGGAWKQFILRVLLLGEPDIRFPVTLCQEHPTALSAATSSQTSRSSPANSAVARVFSCTTAAQEPDTRRGGLPSMSVAGLASQPARPAGAMPLPAGRFGVTAPDDRAAGLAQPRAPATWRVVAFRRLNRLATAIMSTIAASCFSS